MKIRKMLDEDVSAIAEMEKNVFSPAWNEKDIQIMKENEFAICLVAVESEEVLGYCLSQYAYETADLDRIAVKKVARHQGIAGKLHAELVRKCREKEVERILLEVRASNAPAICFYEKNGYCQITTRKNYYSQPKEDAWIYEFSLD